MNGVPVLKLFEADTQVVEELPIGEIDPLYHRLRQSGAASQTSVGSASRTARS